MILTDYALWTLRFWPCCTLNWLYTVLVTYKVYVKPTIYRRSLFSFTKENRSKNVYSFGDPLLPLLDLFIFDVTQFDVLFCFVLGLSINMMTVKIKTIVLWDQLLIVFLFNQKYMLLMSCWFNRKIMWQVRYPLYLTGIHLISWIFLFEWFHTKINFNQKFCNIICHGNNSINVFNMIKKYFKD